MTVSQKKREADFARQTAFHNLIRSGWRHASSSDGRATTCADGEMDRGYLLPRQKTRRRIIRRHLPRHEHTDWRGSCGEDRDGKHEAPPTPVRGKQSGIFIQGVINRWYQQTLNGLFSAVSKPVVQVNTSTGWNSYLFRKED